jgi:acylphosphatase
MEDKTVKAHIFIEGMVQGIFYRMWTREQAQKLGLAGWVRNLEDGRVEAVFEGPKDKVEKMVKKCHKGPNLAGIEHVDVNWEEATGELGTFEITR